VRSRKTAPRYDFPQNPLCRVERHHVGCRGSDRRELEQRVKQLKEIDKLLEAQRIQQRTRYDIEMIRELGLLSGHRELLPLFVGASARRAATHAFEYMPDNALVLVDESHVTIPQIGGMYRGDRSRKETLVEYGFRLPSALDNRPLKFEEWEQLPPGHLCFCDTPGHYENEHAGQTVEQVVRPTGLVDPSR
jgi:excinuclease ABC subunit B